MDKMNKKKSIKQLKSLIEHFNNGARDINDDDIEAIKYVLGYVKAASIDLNELFERMALINMNFIDTMVEYEY